VKLIYRDVAMHPERHYHFEMGRALAEKLGYDSEMLSRIPEQAIRSFAGVGYFFDLARIRRGESIIDLGSGSGMDVFYASLLAGSKGSVTGVDMTSEQLDKANILSIDYSMDNVGFIKGYLEGLPLPADCADLVISNGVINLSADKTKVFHEAARVLKPGGRIAIADIVSLSDIPGKISSNASLWASCIGGATQIDRYYEYIEDAGFSISQIKMNKSYGFLSKNARLASDKYGIKSISLLAIKN